jgi:hypothetical protein
VERRLLSRIAREEMRHAALGADIFAWCARSTTYFAGSP